MGCPNGHAMLFWFFEVIRFSKEVGIGFQDTEVQLSALCSCILVDWDSTKACTKGTLFFGEKYIIEYLTKKTIDSYIFNFNNIFNYLNLDYSYFFVQLTSFLLYFLTLLNIFFLLNL